MVCYERVKAAKFFQNYKGRKFLIHYYINIDITINIIVIILLMLYITPILRYITHYTDVHLYIYILMYVQACAPAYECEFMFTGKRE